MGFLDSVVGVTTFGQCNTGGCGNGHTSNILNDAGNVAQDASPANIAAQVIQQILQALEPLIVPFLLIIGGVILLPVLFDIIIAII